jgi:hypothetical protein
MKLRIPALLAFACAALGACAGSGYAVRPVPRIAADTVGRSVSLLEEAFGEPRTVTTAPTRLVYVWFIAATPPGASQGLHGCELEVTVEPRSRQVLGYALSNIGWVRCGDIERRVRVLAS